MRTRGYTEEAKKKGRTAQAGQTGPYPPEGEYRVVKIDDAREVEVGRGTKLELTLILDVNGENVERRWSGWTDNEAQMANAAEAIAQPNDPDDLHPDDMIGRGGFRAVVKHQPGKDRDGNPKTWANVVYLLPAAGSGQRQGQDRARDDRRDERPRGDDRGRRDEPRRDARRDDRRDERPSRDDRPRARSESDDQDLPF